MSDIRKEQTTIETEDITTSGNWVHNNALGVQSGVKDADATTPIKVGDASNTTYNTVNQTILGNSNTMLTAVQSSGTINGGAISDAGGGNADVAAGTGFLRSTDAHDGILFEMSWSQSLGNAIPSGQARYMGVEYNAGSPQVVVKSADTWNYHDEFPLGSVVNEGGTLHILDNPAQVQNATAHALERFYETEPFKRADRLGGIILGETGTRNVTVSAGELYDRFNEFIISAIDTSVSGGFDTYVDATQQASAQTQWDNANYNNGGTLTALTANRYANLWFYIEADGDLVMLYGTAQYVSSATAENEGAPVTIPLRLQTHGKLIGRIIFQEGASSATSIESVFNTAFATTLATSHANLSNLDFATSGHTGLLPQANGGTGIDTSGATDGQLLIGGTSSNDLQLAVLTGTVNQITVVNATNSITLSTPQDIDATASPTFAKYQIGSVTVLSTNASETGGNRNTFVGETLIASNTGADNTYIGDVAGFDATSGDENTAVGSSALPNITSGSRNTVIGYIAGREIATADDNTILGYGAMRNAGDGAENTVIGSGAAGSASGTQSGNTIIGYQAGYNVTDGDNNVFIGYQAGYSETGSNKLYIDNTNTATPLIHGDFSTNALTVNGSLTVTNLSDGVVKATSGLLSGGNTVDLTSEVTGILPQANGGTGIDTSGVTDGQLLIGGTLSNDLQLTTISGTANQVTVTNGTNSITLSTPQDINSGATPTFVNVIGSNAPTADNHLTRKDYVDGLVQGIAWQDPVKDEVDFTTVEPGSPSIGDRYINTVTGTSSGTAQSVTATYIYEWNGSDWTEIVPAEGWAVYIEDIDQRKSYNGTAWVDLGSTVLHANLGGLQGGTTSEYYHLTSAQHTSVTGVTAAEYTQLANIDTTTISSTQWGYLGAMDQGMAKATSPDFAGLTLSGLGVANGIVQTDGSGVFSSSVTLPDGTLGTTQSSGDNSTKLATTAYVDTAVTVEDVWDRVTGTPNYVIPATTADDIGATAARITKGWFTDLESTNAPTVSGSDVYYAGGTDVALADGGTGIDSSGATDGQLLIGGTAINDLQLATLTGTSNQITVTNGTNSITLSTPQNIDTGASVTFADLTVGNTGLTVGTSVPFSDSSGTLTLQNIDVLDVTTEATIESAIDSLSGLTSIQGQAVTFSGTLDVVGNSKIDQDLRDASTTVRFEDVGIGNPVAANIKLNVFSNTTSETVVASFHQSHVGNGGHGVQVLHDGTGRGLLVQTGNAANSQATVEINQSGTGPALKIGTGGAGIELVGETDVILYGNSSDNVTGLALGNQDEPLLSNGTTSAPKFGTMRLGPSIISAAGATPVDSDVSSWNNDTIGIVKGTGGRIWVTFKNSTDVYLVEATAL